MENSNLPETSDFATKYGEAVGGAMTFHDLDVLEDQAL